MLLQLLNEAAQQNTWQGSSGGRRPAARPPTRGTAPRPHRRPNVWTARPQTRRPHHELRQPLGLLFTLLLGPLVPHLLRAPRATERAARVSKRAQKAGVRTGANVCAGVRGLPILWACEGRRAVQKTRAR
eukprot:104985-Chlamydomonas_euryale.AAC.1